MIDFINSWAEQIVLAVIVATIIELILPNNKNKKYVKMVIGVYILFNIISPIINNKDVLSVDQYITQNNIVNDIAIDETTVDKRLEKIYLEELEKNITGKFEENGYIVNKCKIDAVLNSNQKNAGIHSITVKIEKTDETSKLDEIKKAISQEYEISENKVNIIIR